MKLGVIGTARIAKKSVLPALMNVKAIEPYAIAGRNQDKVKEFSNQFGFKKSYSTYDDLLEDKDIDSVYIPLPNGMHYEYIKKALNKGLHVICEKPLATNKAQVEELFRLAQEKGLVLQEAFAYRLSPIHQMIKEQVEEGIIGRIKYMEARFTFPMSDSSNVRLSRDLLGGATYDVGCYNLNLLRFMAGSEPQSIKAAGQIHEDLEVDVESTVILDFPNQIKGISHCSFDERFSNAYTLYGTEGKITLPKAFNAAGQVEVIIETDQKTVSETFEITDNYQLELEYFYECTQGNVEQIVDQEDSVNNAGVIDEVLRQIGY